METTPDLDGLGVFERAIAPLHSIAFCISFFVYISKVVLAFAYTVLYIYCYIVYQAYNKV